MSTFFGSVWWLIVTLGLLVTFHEFGHFWVARRCGVKVLRFSVGFGRAIWSRVGRDGTEYRIAMIPLGGYVKMLDAREGEVPEDQKDQEFTGKSVWKRIAIVAAGPGFNLIFAVAAFWLMFVIGKPDAVPVLAAPPSHTLAAEAGIRSGDRIVAVDGNKVVTWSGALDAISEDALLRQPVRLDVRHQGEVRTVTLALNELPADTAMQTAFDRIGLLPGGIPPVVGKLVQDGAAAKAGIQSGDRILSIDDTPVHYFTDIGTILDEHMKHASSVEIAIRRQDRTLKLALTPKHVIDDGKDVWRLGVYNAPAKQETAILRYGPIAALGHAFATTWDKTATTFQMIGRILTGQASARNLSGVITIARVANASAQLGLTWFLGFLGLVSLSLAVINLLPIPVLDGGHLLYYLIELVKGSPVSERTMIAGQFIGLALLACLVGLALYNDILGLSS
ncbi:MULTISPECIES: RIP metalloprotease RseP [Oleiagrimonas]|uniref:Zinc metalloprotease n=1 Tax=Oleiagrimonas citrea TaxID=1665687 RepID=A0A846ZKL2_9GAMM|nr:MULTISPECIES: RIP metalloprotease RseP [Oleiagrimonas]NKZ37931.1 RIP metalloprotease RseP [Oleiagrimonas citrea]RAP57427.1 RIP metalloprotease RseP [Oleiagrimonas sp. MCCC 1A03011]